MPQKGREKGDEFERASDDVAAEDPRTEKRERDDAGDEGKAQSQQWQGVPECGPQRRRDRRTAYGNVLRDQKTGFGNRVIGAVLQNPDIVAFAKSFGIEAHRVDTPEDLRPVLSKALQAARPVFIEVVVPQGSEVSPWDFIHPKR